MYMTIEKRLSLLEQQMAAQVPTPTEYYTSRWSGEEIDNRIASLSNQNLLDNWYFVGGGSQQGGGQFPINQRGETSYTSLNQQIYTVDRWFSTASGSFSVTSQGLSLVGNCALFQRLEPSRIPDDAHITFSVLWDDGELTVCSGTKYEQGTKAESDRTISFGYDSVTYSGIIWVYIASTTTSTKTIVAAKLELGSHQTLARQDADGNWVLLDPPPNFQQESLKCKYYANIGTFVSGPPYYINADQIHFIVPAPPHRAIVPTIYNPSGIFVHNGLTQQQTGFSFIMDENVRENQFCIICIKANHGLDRTCYIEFNSAGFSMDL